MTAPPPEFSILISTRDRAGRLRLCLDHLLRLEGNLSREFVLIDNGSTDGTSEEFARFRDASPWPVILQRELRPGASRGLNKGLEYARGNILIFIDDDCYADPGLIAGYDRLFTDSRVGYAAGRILLHDPSDAPLAIRVETCPELMPPNGFVAPGRVQGANMAFRRRVLLAIGGFDSNFGAGARFSGFDVEAGARASDAGWTGLYDPQPLVHHHHGRKAGEARRHARRYAEGGGAYFAKRLIESPHRMRDLGAILRLVCASRSPFALFRHLRGFARYTLLWMTGRLQPAAPALAPPVPEPARISA